jgi:tetratricopeptide (TPR) repeat protein
MNDHEVAQIESAIDSALAAGDMDRAEELTAHYRAAAPESLGSEPAQSPRFRAAYLAAKVSLAASRMDQAVERLTPLLSVTAQLPAELTARIQLMLAEALARLQRRIEARASLDRVPSLLLDRNPLSQLRALRIRLLLGEVDQRAEELAACARALEAQGESAGCAQLAYEEGRAWEVAGDPARAEHCWRRAEHLSRNLHNGNIHADILLRLGRLDHLRGHLPAALERYDAALGCASPGAQALEVELRLLLVRLELNQWRQFRARAEELLTGLRPESLPEELRPLVGMIQWILGGSLPDHASDEDRAHEAADRGDVESASRLYRQALAATPSPQRQARLALAQGLLLLAHGHRTEALGWLRQTEELARTYNLPEVLRRALQGQGEAALDGGDDTLAKSLFEEVVLISEVQARLFQHGSDAADYRQQQGSVLRHLLRAACQRGDAARMLRYQELERGRLLLELWGAAAPRQTPGHDPFFDRPDLTDLEREIAACEQELAAVPAGTEEHEKRREALQRYEGLRLRRDRLFEGFLCDRTRRGSAALPALPELSELQLVLPAGTQYVAPSVVDDVLYLLVATREGPACTVRGFGSASDLFDTIKSWRACLRSQLARYRAGLPLGRPEREEMDDLLGSLGRGPLGSALNQALAASGNTARRLLWVPDDPLHGVPIHAVRRQGRYLIQDLEIMWSFSAASVVHQARTRRQQRGFVCPAVVVTETSEVLPEATREGAGVAASFLVKRTLHGTAATKAKLRPWLQQARVMHFACHADFDSEHPLEAYLGLPSGERMHALEWLDQAAAGLPLVTLSACRSAEVARLQGREVFGLVTGLLGGGVRAVLAGLWPVADREAVALMWRFYRARMTGDLATALTQAQRDSLADEDSSPLFWAAFALFGDAAALPAPGWTWRWLARWRQHRHEKRFPVPGAATTAPVVEAAPNKP